MCKEKRKWDNARNPEVNSGLTDRASRWLWQRVGILQGFKAVDESESGRYVYGKRRESSFGHLIYLCVLGLDTREIQILMTGPCGQVIGIKLGVKPPSVQHRYQAHYPALSSVDAPPWLQTLDCHGTMQPEGRKEDILVIWYNPC